MMLYSFTCLLVTSTFFASLADGSSYEEPILIPDNLLRNGKKSIFDAAAETEVSASSRTSTERSVTAWPLKWQGPATTAKLDGMSRRPGLTIGLSGVRLPVVRNATRDARPTPSNQAPHPKARRLPKNANALQRWQCEALAQGNRILALARVNSSRHMQPRTLLGPGPAETSLRGPSPSTLPALPSTHRAAQSRRLDVVSSVPSGVPTGTSIELSLDPQSLAHLLGSSIRISVALAQAFGATLRFLAPLVVTRRGLMYVEDMGMDWYRGRYLRTTYHQVHHEYHHTYQVPAVLRSVGRLSAQIVCLFLLGRLMEHVVVGLDQSHCHPSTLSLGTGVDGCSWLCCIWWMITTMGLGHAGATAMSVWGGPLRVQTESKRPVAKQIFTKPWKLLHWMRDPDRWLRDIAGNQRKDLKPFHPNRLLFPATWQPLYFLQLASVASAMTGKAPLRHTLMRYLLLQQAFGDEWFRMLMVEKRVALSIALVLGYYVTTVQIFRAVAAVSSLGTCLSFPYLLSVIISGWMNVSIYFERRRRDKREPTPTVPALDQPFGPLTW